MNNLVKYKKIIRNTFQNIIKLKLLFVHYIKFLDLTKCTHPCNKFYLVSMPCMPTYPKHPLFIVKMNKRKHFYFVRSR